MAKLRPTEDEIVSFAFFLALEGLEEPPPGAFPRLYPADIWTKDEIFKCLSRTFGHRAAKWAMGLRLFTLH